MPEAVLVIACGALAREIIALKKRYGWVHLDMQCLDARLHNRPERIPDRIREKIAENTGRYDRIFVAYADCGTGGAIDRVLSETGTERLPGPHCYQVFAGAARFDALSNTEPGTFYLTDFLARNFERLVLRPLDLLRSPELRDAYFGNYRRLVYLAQENNPDTLAAAQAAARRLNLEFEHVHCGYGGLEDGLVAALTEQDYGQENSRLLA